MLIEGAGRPDGIFTTFLMTDIKILKYQGIFYDVVFCHKKAKQQHTATPFPSFKQVSNYRKKSKPLTPAELLFLFGFTYPLRVRGHCKSIQHCSE